MTPITVGQHKFVPNVIALDPASTTGVAWLEPNVGPMALSPIMSLTLNFAGDWGERTHKMFSFVMQTEVDSETVIAYECAIQSHHATHFTHEHGMLRGAIECAARHRNLRTLFFNVSTVKSFATGNGAAKKPQMMRACQTLLGITPPNDNECDAIWVLALASHTLLGGVMHDLKPRKIKPKRRKASVPTLFR